MVRSTGSFYHRRAVAVREHSAPKLWDSLRPVLLQHLKLGESKCLCDVCARRELPVKLAHKCKAEKVVRRPQVRDDTACAGSEKRPHETRNPFLAETLSRAGVTRRQGDQIRPQLQSQNLARL